MSSLWTRKSCSTILKEISLVTRIQAKQLIKNIEKKIKAINKVYKFRINKERSSSEDKEIVDKCKTAKKELNEMKKGLYSLV